MRDHPIVHDLKKIHSLKKAYIYREGKESISTFSINSTTTMRSSVELIEQYFMAAQGIEKSYNEMIFPLDNGDNIIAYLIDEATLVIALTEEKINLPMLHMALIVIIKKLNNNAYQKKTAHVTTISPQKPVQQQKPSVSRPKPQAFRPQTLITSTTKKEKKPALSLRSLFSNPFSTPVKKASSKPSYTLLRGQKIYQNEAKKKLRPLPTDKKLVHRE